MTNVAELGANARRVEMAKIKHMAIWTDDPEKLAKFYCDTFGARSSTRA